ncbi:MAG: imidazole glycerol phosphate synthase subunit HisH [Acidobacteria bacterium]|nr:imidazole glycerol phosphate synthase subunit HisH [Acidobacteriota bacterium]
MKRIALIDYGAGNLTSVRKGFVAAGADLFTPDSPSALAGMSAIVVPGVGHFAATSSLSDGWREAIAVAVRQGTPLLGICLGLQWLFEGSEEAPDVPGLGAIPGRCFRLPPPLKVPHVGWNALEPTPRPPSALLEGVHPGTHMYFTHSYAAPVTDACAAWTSHGVRFASVVDAGNVFGVQFHPEKSSDSGIRILENFVRISCSRNE